MTKVLDRLNDFLAVVVSIILVLMTLTIGYAIFARAVGLPGPVWIVQFNEYAMLLATFLGAAWLLSKKKTRFHRTDRFPPQPRNAEGFPSHSQPFGDGPLRYSLLVRDVNNSRKLPEKRDPRAGG